MRILPSIASHNRDNHGKQKQEEREGDRRRTEKATQKRNNRENTAPQEAAKSSNIRLREKNKAIHTAGFNDRSNLSADPHPSKQQPSPNEAGRLARGLGAHERLQPQIPLIIGL